MKFLNNLLLAFWLVFGAMAAHATLLMPQSQMVNLIGDAQYLEDASGQLLLADVKALDQQFRPWNQGGTEMNFGFTGSAYWIRVPLQGMASAAPNWLLELPYAKLNELDFYSPHASPIHTGSNRPFASRPYFDRFFVIPLEVTPQQEYFYLRVTSSYALTVPMKLWAPDAFREHQNRFELMQFMYFGGLVVLAMYGLMIYLSLRDARFLTYSAYIVTAGIGIFASNGFGRQLLWPEAADFDAVSQSAFLSFAAYFAVLFARQVLLAPSERSRLTLAMYWSQSFFLVTGMMSLSNLLVPGLLRPANQLLMLNSVIMGLLVGMSGLRAWRQNRQGIRFFLLGWLALWVGIATASLRAFGVLPSNGITSYAVQLSTVVEMLMMAMALGDLLRLENEAHMAAQAETLMTKQALLDLSQASEGQLKLAVKERTEQLEASLKQEKHLREQYVRFGSMISHEFRTPLSIIQSQASLMRKEYEHGIDQSAKRLDAIAGATQRLKVMFDKWLHSDALNETLEVLDRKPLELHTWVSTLIQTHPHLFPNHTVELLHRSSAPVHVIADAYHLDLALSNLIDNAAKYSPEKSTITVEVRHKSGYIGIAVTDQGPGIAQEVQDKVFSEFFRVAPESHVRGVGLGLSIVQRITQAHEGHVELTSTPGDGATFCIWLPAT